MRSGLICILLCCSLTIAAQPGYLGKKFTLTYNVPISLTFSGLSTFADPAPFKAYTTQSWYREFVLNLRHQVEADYVVGRMSSAGGGLFRLRTASAFSYDEGFFVGHATTGCFGYLKVFKVNRRGAVAPIGPWGRVGAGLYLTKFLTDNIADSLVASSNPTSAAPMIILSLGNTRVFGNRIIVNVATDLILSTYLTSPRVLTSEFIRSGVSARVPGHLFLNFSAGIGGLF